MNCLRMHALSGYLLKPVIDFSLLQKNGNVTPMEQRGLCEQLIPGFREIVFG